MWRPSRAIGKWRHGFNCRWQLRGETQEDPGVRRCKILQTRARLRNSLLAANSTSPMSDRIQQRRASRAGDWSYTLGLVVVSLSSPGQRKTRANTPFAYQFNNLNSSLFGLRVCYLEVRSFLKWSHRHEQSSHSTVGRVEAVLLR
jgi:hypothetical protein